MKSPQLLRAFVRSLLGLVLPLAVGFAAARISVHIADSRDGDAIAMGQGLVSTLGLAELGFFLVICLGLRSHGYRLAYGGLAAYVTVLMISAYMHRERWEVAQFSTRQGHKVIVEEVAADPMNRLEMTLLNKDGTRSKPITFAYVLTSTEKHLAELDFKFDAETGYYQLQNQNTSFTISQEGQLLAAQVWRSGLEPTTP